MNCSQIKTTLHKYWPLYFLTIILALVIKYFCKISDSDALTWILTPTAWWVSILGKISFEYLPHMGYASHSYRFLIAPSCSGIRFMLLVFLMLMISFLHQIRSQRAGYLWFYLSIAFSYISTVFVNGIRITVSIYLPILLENWGLMDGWLTSEKLHTLIGCAVYFSFLYIIYLSAAFICQHGFLQMKEKQLLIPAFWYLLIVLGIPSLGRACRNEWSGFGEYAVLIIGECLVILLLLRLCHALHRHKQTEDA